MLHSSVYERAARGDVPRFYDRRKYDPDNLAGHIKFQQAKNPVAVDATSPVVAPSA
jgi:hypothetical protein